MPFCTATPRSMITITLTTTSVFRWPLSRLRRFAQRSTVRNFMFRLESADVFASQVTLN